MFEVQVKLASLTDSTQTEELSLLVDTGATLSWIPRHILEQASEGGAHRKFGRLYVAVAILGVILGIIAVTSWVAHRRYELRAAFDKVHLGASKSEVVRQLGRPWKVSRCGVTFGDGSPPGCVEEVIYRAPFATRTPRYWSFQFDAEGKLMSKWEDLSP